MPAADPRRTAQLNAEYAKKLAARRDGSANVQTYPANRGAGLIASIRDVDARYAAKLAAHIDATRNDGPPKADAKASVSEAEALAVLDAATKPESKPKRV